MNKLVLLALAQCLVAPSVFAATTVPAFRGHITVIDAQVAPNLQVSVSYDELTSCSDDSIASVSAPVDADGNFVIPAMTIPDSSGSLGVNLGVQDTKMNTGTRLAGKDSLTNTDIANLPATLGVNYVVRQTRLNFPVNVSLKWTDGLTLDQYVKAIIAAHPDLAKTLRGAKGLTYTISGHDFVGSRIDQFNSLTWISNPNLHNNGDLADSTMGAQRELNMSLFETPSFVYLPANSINASLTQYLASVPDGDRAGGESNEPILIQFIAKDGFNMFQQLGTVTIGAIKNQGLSNVGPSQVEIRLADPQNTSVRNLEKVFFSRAK